MSKSWLIGGGSFVAVLLLVSIVLALTQTEAVLPEGTPEGAVQRFLKALESQDYKLAYSYLGEKLTEKCAVEDLAARKIWQGRELESSRVTLEETINLDDSAVVVARVNHIRGDGPFGTSESSRDERFTLAKQQGEWRFTRDPWPYYGCGERRENLDEPARVSPAPPPGRLAERETTTTPARES